MKKFEFIYFGQLLIASSEYIFLCLTFCLVKLPPTFDGMVSCGITKRKSISLHRPFLRATNARKPLKPACTIPCVGVSLFIQTLIIHISHDIVPIDLIFQIFYVLIPRLSN